MFYEKLKNKLELRHTTVATVHSKIEHTFDIIHLNIRSRVDCKAISEYCILQKELSQQGLTTKSKDRPHESLISAWHSDFIYEETLDPIFVDLCKVVKEQVNLLDTKYSYFMDALLYTVYEKNQGIIPHDHGYADFTTVFYPNVPKNAPPLTIIGDDSEIDVLVTNGSLVMFSGKVMHYVKDSNQDYVGNRIIVSLNFIKEKLNKDRLRTPIKE